VSGPLGSRLRPGRAVRKPVRRLLSILPVSLLVLLVTAVPALAAEEEQYTGTFAGLAYAAIAGIVLGVVYFLALPKGPAADEHDDHH
jgi:hypothetical protein